MGNIRPFTREIKRERARLGLTRAKPAPIEHIEQREVEVQPTFGEKVKRFFTAPIPNTPRFFRRGGGK